VRPFASVQGEARNDWTGQQNHARDCAVTAETHQRTGAISQKI
jgi:hypothetical protein